MMCWICRRRSKRQWCINYLEITKWLLLIKLHIILVTGDFTKVFEMKRRLPWETKSENLFIWIYAYVLASQGRYMKYQKFVSRILSNILEGMIWRIVIYEYFSNTDVSLDFQWNLVHVKYWMLKYVEIYKTKTRTY